MACIFLSTNPNNVHHKLPAVHIPILVSNSGYRDRYSTTIHHFFLAPLTYRCQPMQMTILRSLHSVARNLLAVKVPEDFEIYPPCELSLIFRHQITTRGSLTSVAVACFNYGDGVMAHKRGTFPASLITPSWFFSHTKRKWVSKFRDHSHVSLVAQRPHHSQFHDLINLSSTEGT